jgi:hypothetical protein
MAAAKNAGNLERHLEGLAGPLTRASQLCAKAESVKLGDVAINGTKIKANTRTLPFHLVRVASDKAQGQSPYRTLPHDLVRIVCGHSIERQTELSGPSTIIL